MSAVEFRPPLEMKLVAPAFKPNEPPAAWVTPGDNCARLKTDRLVRGRSLMNFWFTSCPVEASCVCSRVAVASTSTFSAVPWISKSTLTSAFWPTVSVNGGGV